MVFVLSNIECYELLTGILHRVKKIQCIVLGTSKEKTSSWHHSLNNSMAQNSLGLITRFKNQLKLKVNNTLTSFSSNKLIDFKYWKFLNRMYK